MTNHPISKVASVIEEQESYEIKFAGQQSSSERKILLYQKRLLDYKGKNIALTDKQIEILKFVAKGFSNTKIAQNLNRKEAAIKLLIYRLMKYLEHTLNEKIDRFYLIIIAQEFSLDND